MVYLFNMGYFRSSWTKRPKVDIIHVQRTAQKQAADCIA